MRAVLVLAILTTLAAPSPSPSPSPSDVPKQSPAELIVGAWVPAPKGPPEGLFPCEFFADGKFTTGGGKAKTKGTYKVSEEGLHTVVEITLERDGKSLPPEKGTISFPSKDRMVWYPEWQWKGVALDRQPR